jgi:D-glycero-alpha-D-manno-heptose-7-phosphate kinase
MIKIAMNIETQVIKVPAGCQDYFPAMYGGVRKVVPGVQDIETEKFSINLPELTRNFVLCYTGKPRNSGINNWEITKLAPNISTPQMDQLFRSAMRKGAMAGKVCGAGGGGCIAFIVPPAKKQSIIEELTSNGGKVLPFHFVSRGLRH